MKIVEQLNELKDIKEGLRQTVNNKLYLCNAVPKIFQNIPMGANAVNGWTASASHDNSGSNKAYVGFNKNMAGENAWWTGNSVTFPCWLSLSFNDLYKVHSVEIMNEVATPANFRNALIQFRASEDVEWETLYEIIDRPNTASYSEIYPIVSNLAYKEFRVLFTTAWSSTVSIQNINLVLEHLTIKEKITQGIGLIDYPDYIKPIIHAMTVEEYNANTLN